MNNSSTQSTIRRKMPSLIATAIATGTLVLAGCGVKNAEEAGRKIDQAAANAGKQAEQVGQKIEKKADEAGAALREAGKDVKGTASEVAADARDAVASTANSAGKAADKTGQIAQDAGITASIKVDLAKDPRLSALTISVDTHGGEVILRGDVKSQADKERAGNIARNIVGVTKVTNDLKVVA